MVALQVAAENWRAIKLQHDGKDIRLREWREFLGQDVLYLRNVEDSNQGDKQPCMVNRLPESRIKPVSKEEAKGTKSYHTVTMMISKVLRKRVINWSTKNVARHVKEHSLQNALLLTVRGHRQNPAVWKLDQDELRCGRVECMRWARPSTSEPRWRTNITSCGAQGTRYGKANIQPHRNNNGR